MPPKKKKTNKAESLEVDKRRGLQLSAFAGHEWSMLLVRSSRSRRGKDELDTVTKRLVQSKLLGAVEHDVTDAVFAGKVPAPLGRWALLVRLHGQPWSYLLPSWQDPSLGSLLSESGGLVTLECGYQDTAGVAYVVARNGKEKFLEYQASDKKETQFESDRHPRSWWKSFETVVEAQDALLRELDAYVPLMAAGVHQGPVGLTAFDDFGDLPREAFLRIDLVVFGKAAAPGLLEQGQKLKEAIEKSNPAKVRAAIAAGASLESLPGSQRTPLGHAISCYPADKGLGVAVVGALLDAGADPNELSGGIPPIAILAARDSLEERFLLGSLKHLVAHGADPHALGTLGDGLTAIHALVKGKRLASLKFLHSQGVDLLHCQSRAGRSPLEEAIVWHAEKKQLFGETDSDTLEMQAIVDYLQSIERGEPVDDDYAHLLAADRHQNGPEQLDPRLAKSLLGQMLGLSSPAPASEGRPAKKSQSSRKREK